MSRDSKNDILLDELEELVIKQSRYVLNEVSFWCMSDLYHRFVGILTGSPFSPHPIPLHEALEASHQAAREIQPEWQAWHDSSRDKEGTIRFASLPDQEQYAMNGIKLITSMLNRNERILRSRDIGNLAYLTYLMFFLISPQIDKVGEHAGTATIAVKRYFLNFLPVLGEYSPTFREVLTLRIQLVRKGESEQRAKLLSLLLTRKRNLDFLPSAQKELGDVLFASE